MSTKEIVLTYEGLQKLENELSYLKGVKRKEIAERIKQALAFGDISENSEYDEAKNEQAQMEIRIAHIETMLKHVSVIDEDEVNTDVVSLGAHVTVWDMEFEEEVDYHIVGSTEADPSSYKISNESPVGSALLGHQIDDVVDVQVPDGIVKFKIIQIHK